MKPFEYFRPKSLKEALTLLQQFGAEASLLNGGTDLIVRMREGHSAPKAVIDIKGIPGLDQIHVTDDRLTIGACVTLNQLEGHETIKREVPYLAEAARMIGSKQVRNRATCIGNICNASPIADTATPLLALDATVLVYGESGVKEIPMQSFFVFVRQTVLEKTDIVTGITFKRPQGILGQFTKISRRKEVDLSTVCGTFLRGEKGYRISFGAVAPTPIRLFETESYLDGVTLSPQSIEAACQIALKEIAPISDIRASEDYRREMVSVTLRRALTEWL